MNRFWSLKKKLLLFSLVLMSLPFLGVGFLKQVENMLADNLLQNLSEFAGSIAFTLQQQPIHSRNIEVRDSNEKRFYVPSLSRPLNIDGYSEDWLPVRGFARRFSENNLEVEAGVARGAGQLFAQITVKDKTPSYREVSDEFSISDQILVTLADAQNRRALFLFAPVAVGQVRPFQLHNDFSDLWISQAIWQEHEEGYTLEWVMPLNHQWRSIGFEVKNHDPVTDEFTTVRSYQKDLNPLQWPMTSLEHKLADLSLSEGKRIWVLDAQGQVLARHGSLIPDLELAQVNPLIHFLLAPPLSGFSDPRSRAIEISLPEVKSALQGNRAQTLELIPGTETAIALVAVPLLQSQGEAAEPQVVGVVMVEETVAAIQMIQREAMNAFVNTTLVILLLVIVTLIIVASRITARVMRLSRQTTAAVDDHGRVIKVIEPEKAGDEIGELSTNFSRMSVRLKEYNEYMEKLASRLTHELRTPIATVRSSIDNIALSDNAAIKDDPAIKDAITHAQQGIERLSNMITRMREAARLEQSILSLDKADVELVEFVRQYLDATASLYPDHELKLIAEQESCNIHSHPEVIAQLLDKLLSNARDFADVNSTIEVHVSSNDHAKNRGAARWVTLAVSNQGPALPLDDPEQLFSSMVSERSRDYRSSDQAHLGLGLYIVRLIAEYHKGRYFARNLENASGVMVGIEIPY